MVHNSLFSSSLFSEEFFRSYLSKIYLLEIQFINVDKKLANQKRYRKLIRFFFLFHKNRRSSIKLFSLVRKVRKKKGSGLHVNRIM